jgi:hypothetical protein
MSLQAVIRCNMDVVNLPHATLQRILADAAHAGVRSYLEELEDDKAKRISILGTHFFGNADRKVRMHAQEHYVTKKGMPRKLLCSHIARKDNQDLVVALLHGELKMQVDSSRLPGLCPKYQQSTCDVMTRMTSSRVVHLHGSVTNGSHL